MLYVCYVHPAEDAGVPYMEVLPDFDLDHAIASARRLLNERPTHSFAELWTNDVRVARIES